MKLPGLVLLERPISSFLPSFCPPQLPQQVLSQTASCTTTFHSRASDRPSRFTFFLRSSSLSPLYACLARFSSGRRELESSSTARWLRNTPPHSTRSG